MQARMFALVLGLAFLVGGVLGFVPALLRPGAGPDGVNVVAGYGVLAGLFPVNAVHNLLYLAFGVWGVVVWRSVPASRGFARWVAMVFLALAVLGLVPVLRTVFGVLPLNGNNIWLHAALAALAAYFGWSAQAAEEPAG
jgi:hypothetical protein